MTTDLQNKLKLLFETAVICENEDKIKKLCNQIADETKNKKDVSTLLFCRKKLRLLENEKCRQAKSTKPKEFELSKLIENLSICSDIILSEKGKTVFCKAQKCVCSCCPENIIDIFLNLISNAAKYGNDNFISVFLEADEKKIRLTVKNSGDFDFSSLHGGGISAASNLVLLNRGRFFIASKKDSTEAVLSLPNLPRAKENFSVPEYTAFLSDGFSPVYVGLSDVF